ncbi:DoxX family protein [uncultured Draconibacterium sp.]|uniref:DoxX family protein n=1 Tax=uncultured Draconibacterium sp. TaxID=1573823 RepID=UPI0025E582CD|nr:DoxX family protein [uncultured Draconibacterium sp.]
MNIALWIIQIILAALFLTSGSIKLVLHKEKLEKVFEWIDDFSQPQLKIIGSFEVLGGLGLFLPGVYATLMILIPLAAIGLAVIMILAIIVHYRRDEKGELIINIIVLLFLLLVIVGRFLLG